jgi:predicted O-methyltransferase YrrM
MNDSLRFNRRQISRLFWETIESYHFHTLPPDDYFEGLRDQATYNTGSLHREDMADVMDIVAYFRPTLIAEVGTFIGRSTYSLAVGSGDKATVYTCDASNDIKLPPMPEGAARVVQFPNTTSTDMFKSLLADKNLGRKIDLFYIDGRVSEEDKALMLQLSNDRTIIVLDDFEGVEKGVANGMLLGTPNHLLIYPRTPDGKTALLVPIQLLQLTAQ